MTVERAFQGCFSIFLSIRDSGFALGAMSLKARSRLEVFHLHCTLPKSSVVADDAETRNVGNVYSGNVYSGYAVFCLDLQSF